MLPYRLLLRWNFPFGSQQPQYIPIEGVHLQHFSLAGPPSCSAGEPHRIPWPSPRLVPGFAPVFWTLTWAEQGRGQPTNIFSPQFLGVHSDSLFTIPSAAGAKNLSPALQGGVSVNSSAKSRKDGTPSAPHDGCLGHLASASCPTLARKISRKVKMPTGSLLRRRSNRSFFGPNGRKMHPRARICCGFRYKRLRIGSVGVVPGHLRFQKSDPLVPRSQVQHSIMHSDKEIVCEHSQERLRWRGTRIALP